MWWVLGYIAGALLTTFILGYLNWEEKHKLNFFAPPAPIVTLFWPLALPGFIFYVVYKLGRAL